MLPLLLWSSNGRTLFQKRIVGFVLCASNIKGPQTNVTIYPQFAHTKKDICAKRIISNEFIGNLPAFYPVTNVLKNSSVPSAKKYIAWARLLINDWIYAIWIVCKPSSVCLNNYNLLLLNYSYSSESIVCNIKPLCLYFYHSRCLYQINMFLHRLLYHLGSYLLKARIE